VALQANSGFLAIKLLGMTSFKEGPALIPKCRISKSILMRAMPHN
jgi:hypothetical protein